MVGLLILAAVGAACIAISPFLFSLVGSDSGYGSLVGFLIALFFVGGRLLGRPAPGGASA